MRINLKQLKLANYKSHQELSLDFKMVNKIIGSNKAGKSTIMDAYLWLLTGKDAQGRSDYEIKDIHHKKDGKSFDAEVVGVFEIMENNKNIAYKKEFKRIYVEKWQRKKGAETQEMTGHETLLFVDNVPVKSSQYSNIVDELFQSKMQVLSNPMHFAALDWKLRRDMIESMVKFDAQPSQMLSNLIKNAGNLEALRKTNAITRSKLKDLLAGIPARIDELSRQYVQVDEESLRERLKAIDDKLDEVKKQDSELNEIIDANRKIYANIAELDNKKSELINAEKFRQNSKYNEANADAKQQIELIDRAVTDLRKTEIEISELSNKIENETQHLDMLREEIKKARGSIFTMEDSGTCMTCGQPVTISEEKKEEMLNRFNQHKVKRINEINEDGVARKARTQDLIGYRLQLIAKIEELKMIASKTKPELIDKPPFVMPGTKEIDAEIEACKYFITEVTKVDNSHLLREKEAIVKELAKVDNNNKLSVRKEELLKEEREYSQQLSALDTIEKELFDYEFATYNYVQERVNKLFSNGVSFEMFRQNINKSFEPCCNILIDGVTFHAANTSGRINAGLHICDVLMKHNDLYLPIFVDNKESVTVPYYSDTMQVVFMEVAANTPFTMIN